MNLRVRMVHDVLAILTRVRRVAKRRDRPRARPLSAPKSHFHTRTSIAGPGRTRARSMDEDRAEGRRGGRTTDEGRRVTTVRVVSMSKAAFAGLKAVQELRFHLCQTSKGSEGVRNFLLSSYKNLKAASPTTPVLIREASGTEGKLYARYDFGVEKCVKLEGLDAKQVEKCLRDLVSSAPQ